MEIHTCYNIKVTENWVITSLHYAITTGLSVLKVKYISVSKRGGVCFQEQLLSTSALTSKGKKGQKEGELCSCVLLIWCLLQK